MADIWPNQPLNLSGDLLVAPLEKLFLGLLVAGSSFWIVIRILPRGWVWDRMAIQGASGTAGVIGTHDNAEKELVGAEGVVVAEVVRIRAEGGAIVATVETTGAQLVVTRGWGQLRTNRRVVTFEESWYREAIVNVARVTGRITGNVFAGTPTIARDVRGSIARDVRGSIGRRRKRAATSAASRRA